LEEKEHRIALTEEELGLFCDAEILLKKNGILNVVENKLNEALHVLETLCRDPSYSNKGYLNHSRQGKLSKGENYGGLPYRILDYPRIQLKESLGLYRTLVWWGNFISFTWHCSGKLEKQLRPAMLDNWNKVQEYDFYLGINASPWIHHFEPENVQPAKEVSVEDAEQTVMKLGYMKLTRKIPLADYKIIAEQSEHHLKMLLSIFSGHF
jgi:hypothetical protein